VPPIKRSIASDETLFEIPTMSALFVVAGVAVIGAFALRPVFTLLGWRRSA